MAIQGLFNKKCSIIRRLNKDTNDFGEIIYSDSLIASDVNCARQIMPGNGDKQVIDKFAVGEVVYKLFKYYMDFGVNIKEGDYIKFEGVSESIVRDVKDGGGRGHHLEILGESYKNVGVDNSVSQ